MSFSAQSILAASDLFSTLTTDDLAIVATMARPVSLRASETLFLKGDSGRTLYVVAQGVVRVSVAAADGRAALLNHLKASQIVGEVAAIDGGTRTADVTAEIDAVLLAFDHRTLLAFLMERPETCLRMMMGLCERLRWVNDLLEDQRFLDARARFAKRLLLLGRLFGQPEDGGIRITIKLSQKDLAEQVGITRERLNRMICQWRSEGLLDYARGYIVILDPDRMSVCFMS